MDCRINRNPEDGSIQSITAENGNKSELFPKLLEITQGDNRAALELYALSQTEEFKEVADLQKMLAKQNLEKATKPETVEETVDFINESGNYFAKVGDRIVGKLYTYDFGTDIKVDKVTVVPEYQGLGIGGNLYRLAIKDAAKANKTFYSDDQTTQDAKRVWESLRKEGIAKQIGNKYVVEPFGPSFDKNGEPSDPRTVVKYAQNSPTNSLSEQERLDVQNAIISLGMGSSEEAYQALHQSLYKDGLIVFTEQRMKDFGFWNSFEIASILASPSLQDTIRQTLQKLSNSEYFEVDYNEDFVFPKATQLNSLGKQIVENPFVKEKEIIEAVSNKTGQELLQALDPATANKFQQNERFRNAIKRLRDNNKVAPVQTIKDEELVDSTQDIAPILPLVLDTQENNKLSDAIELLARQISPEVWNQSLPEVSKILKSVKKHAKKNGIDLRDLPSRALTHSREQILSLLDSMENLLESPSYPTLEAFASIYNEVLEYNQPMNEIINSSSKHDRIVFTDKSEYELFEKHGLVRSTGRIYRQVQEQPLQELYEAFLENKDRVPSGINSVEEFQAYVQKNLDKLDLPDYSMDAEVLEKLFLYKTFFKFPISSGQDAVVITANLPALKIDADYLSFDFVKEFNQWILATDNQYFIVSEAGIQLTQSDPISKQEAVASVPQELRESLAQYDQISKSLNLGILQPTELKQGQIDTQAVRRLQIINNPQSAPKLSGEYTYLKDGVLAAKNQTETFVRTPQGVYEMIYQQGNVNFYGKLPESNPYYKVTNASKPLSDIDFSQYKHLETSPEIWKTMKTYYSAAELKQIEKEHFACQI